MLVWTPLEGRRALFLSTRCSFTTTIKIQKMIIYVKFTIRVHHTLNDYFLDFSGCCKTANLRLYIVTIINLLPSFIYRSRKRIMRNESIKPIFKRCSMVIFFSECHILNVSNIRLTQSKCQINLN